MANKDPRLSLEERYGTHAGYVAAAKKAADAASCKGYLLTGAEAASDGTLPRCSGTVPAGFPNDWKVLVDAAIASNVCNQPGDGGKCNPRSEEHTSELQSPCKLVCSLLLEINKY